MNCAELRVGRYALSLSERARKGSPQQEQYGGFGDECDILAGVARATANPSAVARRFSE